MINFLFGLYYFIFVFFSLSQFVEVGYPQIVFDESRHKN